MPEYLSPGVYVEEFETKPRPMEGVGTSTVGFIGLCAKGPDIGVPLLVTNFAGFRRKYGGYLSQAEFGDYRFLAYAVEHFFINGGIRAFIMRVSPPDAKCAESVSEQTLLKFFAKNPGEWGNFIRVTITPVIKDVDGGVTDADPAEVKTLNTCEFNVEVKYDDQVELYECVGLNVCAANYMGKRLFKSDLVRIEYTPQEEAGDPQVSFEQLAGTDKDILLISMEGGSNGTQDAITPDVYMGADNGPGKRTGIQSFIDNDIVSLMAIPGVTDANVQLALVAHCENLASRFAVLDIPHESKKLDDVMAHRQIFDSHYAAMYHPWLEVFDPLDKKNISIPPSGSVLGIYARSDNAQGVHKAPANEVVRACVGLDCLYNKGEQDMLNPKGVNLIRVFPGQGIRVWGARTCTSNSLWKYINVRRLFIFVEESIKANTNWVVFEPNDELLWIRVKRTIDVFLNTVWRSGALAGGSPAEAFFADVGRSTMSQDDIDNGRLICVIGIAPVKPAEFVIFRITQKTLSE